MEALWQAMVFQKVKCSTKKEDIHIDYRLCKVPATRMVKSFKNILSKQLWNLHGVKLEDGLENELWLVNSINLCATLFKTLNYSDQYYSRDVLFWRFI